MNILKWVRFIFFFEKNKCLLYATAHPNLSHEVYVYLVDDELVLGVVDEWMAPHDAGVVDQYVHRTRILLYPFVQNMNLIPRGNVTFVAGGRAAGFSD